jgi:Ca2+-binding EF-hand superfamily protein
MYQASEIFRTYDINHDGYIDKLEWDRAILMIGYPISHHHSNYIFESLSRGTGYVHERDFCEFWIHHS